MELFISEEDGQRRALMETIFREHFTDVHRYISNKIRQPDVVDDLTSTVFLKAFRWLKEDRGMRQVRSWLYATARTTIAEYWQEQQKRPTLPLEMIENNAIVPFEPLDTEQIQERLQRLLLLLSARERQVLFLHYLQGYTAAEVGQELGLSAGHVRVLQLRALRRVALLEAEKRSLSLMNTPVMIYTEQGQRVLDLAKEEALSFNHHSVKPDHLLLGILSEGSAATPLIEQGATLERIRAGLLSLLGRGSGNSDIKITFTSQSQNVLAQAGKEARERGEAAISPHHILYALSREERGHAIGGVGLLWTLGIERPKLKKQPVDESENERVLLQMEHQIQQYPPLSLEEEQQLASMVARGEAEKRRAESLKETPDRHLIEEGQTAYFRLIYASQNLVLSVAKEYLEPGRDLRELINAANVALTFAVTEFGMKTQVPFRSYAAHWLHLEIIEVLDQ